VVPFHGNRTPHPKTVKEVLGAIEEVSIERIVPE
jgi:hypothetical protein